MLNKKFKLNFIALTVAYALTPYTEAALVRDDVDYQIFRDFRNVLCGGNKCAGKG